MPESNISTCQDVGMWQIFVRWWCSLVVFVAGVRNFVAGVRVVEFGSNAALCDGIERVAAAKYCE